MMFNKVFTVFFIGLSLMSCAQDESKKSGEQAPPPISQKPLPTDCSEKLQLSLNWDQDPKTFQYEVNIGFNPGDYFETTVFNGQTSGYSTNLDRGLTYYLRLAKKQSQLGGMYFKDITVVVPTCENRAAWKAEHPEYEEPLQSKIEWK